MALLYLDSFDHYSTTEIDWKYAAKGSNTTIGTGRTNNGLVMDLGGQVDKPLDADQSEIFMGFAMKITHFNWITQGPYGPYWLMFWNNNTGEFSPHFPDICIGMDVSGRLFANLFGAASNLCITAPDTIRPDTFHYVEIHIVCATGATGAVEIKVDGNSKASATGVATSNDAANITLFTFKNSFTEPDFTGGAFLTIDDLYLANASGIAPTSYLGDIEVGVIYPDGAGRVTQWTANGAASVYQCVDDTTPNSDTDYASEGTVNDVFVTSMQDVPASYSSILAVQIVAAAKKTDVGTRIIALLSGDGMSEYQGPDVSLWSGDYRYVYLPLGLDPIFGTVWSAARVNALQAGVKLTG